MVIKKSIIDLDLSNRTVLVRVDYNVPISSGAVEDDYRIQKSLQTINYLREHNCRVILCSHLGRPDGQVNPELSLAPVAVRLSELLGVGVPLIADCIGDQVSVAVKAMAPGSVILLENLRFHPGEQANDRDFAKALAEPAEYFVQDAFGTVHDKHASTSAITEFLPSAMGFLVEAEVRKLSVAIDNPVRPLVTIIGGAKISDKIELLERFVLQSNILVIGGAMANTFLKAKGFEVGASLYEKSSVDEAKRILKEADKVGIEVILPDDVGVSSVVDVSSDRRDVSVNEVGDTDHILDFGPNTTDRIIEKLDKAGTIIWNGPFGMIELPQFAVASERVGRFIADKGLNCVVGGGDTAGFVHQLDLTEKFTHVSTGGGASLALLSGKDLPGISSLMDK